MNRLVILGLSLLVSACATTAGHISASERRTLLAEVADHLEAERQASEKRDTEAKLRLTSHDDDIVQIGTDEGEFARGWKTIQPLLTAQNTAFSDVKLFMHDKSITISRDGSVAWYAALVDYDIGVGGQRVKLENLRETGVVEKREGRWFTVQKHLSVGYPKQAAPY